MAAGLWPLAGGFASGVLASSRVCCIRLSWVHAVRSSETSHLGHQAPQGHSSPAGTSVACHQSSHLEGAKPRPLEQTIRDRICSQLDKRGPELSQHGPDIVSNEQVVQQLRRLVEELDSHIRRLTVPETESSTTDGATPAQELKVPCPHCENQHSYVPEAPGTGRMCYCPSHQMLCTTTRHRRDADLSAVRKKLHEMATAKTAH